MQQKLILSIYLLINPRDTNDIFDNGQLSIFIHPQYQVDTSFATHMNDLNLLTQDVCFNEILKTDGQIKPIWILLVDRNLSKNSYHIKNIFEYCKMFYTFDFD